MSADYVLVRTQKVAVKGTAFSYRRFGAESSVPLILLTHFRASQWTTGIPFYSACY
jgi:hypothetical protein